MKTKRSRLRIHLSIFGLYSLLALILSWPLLPNIASHVPGVPQWAFDESTFLWNTWYLKYALVDNLSSPLHSDLIWYPLGIDLILYTYNFYHALFAQPMMVAINLPFASNITLLVGTVLSGYGTFLLVTYLLGTRFSKAVTTAAPAFELASPSLPIVLSAVTAGLLYAFASNRAIYATLGHYDMVTTQWIPFYTLALLRSLDFGLKRSVRLKSAALAGLFLAFNGLAEMITALFLAIFTIIVVMFLLFSIVSNHNRERTPGSAGWTIAREMALAGLIIGAVTFIVWSPALVPILGQFLTNDFSLKGWGEAIPLSTDLLGWFTPTVLHPLFGGDVVTELRRVQLPALKLGVTGFRDVNTVFLGWVSLALALIGAILYRSKLSIWIWTALIFGLFTLGPFLQINGRYRFDLDGVDATFPLPYALLHYIPIIKANRAPNRNSVLLMLALAVLAAYGLYWIQRWLTRRNISQRWQIVLPGVLSGLILLEHLALPLPLSDARIPALYDTIAADTRPISVMHSPLGWRNSFGVYGPERTQLQYYQTAHAKPMLGGNISRAPDFKMGYFERIPYFQAMSDIQFGREVPPEVLEAAAAQAVELVYLYNTGYLILMPPIPQRLPYADHWQDSWSFVKETLPIEEEPFYADGGIEAYRLIQPKGTDSFELDLGVAGTFPYRGEGWDATEVDTVYDVSASWATGLSSRLFVPLRQLDLEAAYTLSLRVRPFAYPDSPPQSVAATVNNRELGKQSLSDEWQTVSWQIPGELLINGLNTVELAWSYAQSPRTVASGDRAIGTTGVQLPIDVDIKAFKGGGFIALFDEQGEQTDASAGRRGINVTVLDSKNGEVVASQGFDTASNEYESAALSDFIRTIEVGQPVLVASSGGVGEYLTQEAADALRIIGADVSLESLQGNHLSIVGLAGAPAGSAATVVDPTEAFLRVSLNRDRRPLAAAVDWLQVHPQE